MRVKPPTPSRHHPRGFTLLELMITVAIMAILLAIGIPSFTGLMHSNRLTSSTNEFIAGLYTARTEAVKQSHRVTMCKSTNGASCIATGTWEQGWIVFSDQDHDATVDTGDTVLRASGVAPTGITILGNGNVANYVSFASDGTAKLTTNALQLGTVRVCIASNLVKENARDIVLSATGRFITEKKSVGVTCPAP